MAETALTREQIAQEASSILSTLRDNLRASRSNKLADVKGIFEHAVSIDFDTYFFFLRKYHFIGMDREACLQLTPEGEKIVDGERRERFLEAVQEYFASRIVDPGERAGRTEILADSSIPTDAGLSAPPPPPASSFDEEATQPPHPAGNNNVTVAASVSLPPPPPAVSVYGGSTAGRARVSRRGEPESRRDELPSSLSGGTAAKLPEPARAEPRGQEIDLRYVKYDAIGQGPLGTVYRGRHTALGLDVGIKELKDIFGYFSFLQRSEVIKRLKKEICAQALVRHPSVIGILDQNCDVARPYYVLELCSGGNLRAKLDATGGKGLSPEIAIRYFLQICYGLRAAHLQGLIHGNIKPENVLVDHLGNIRLGDFGLSRVIEVDPSKGMPQVFVGTGGMGYMSPEQLARATRDFGPVTDVYGMGILFYEMLTGQLPGRRSPLPSAVNARVPAKLDPLFDKMTQDRREERYPDFDAVLADFYAAFDDGDWLKKGDLVLSSEGTPPKPEVRA